MGFQDRLRAIIGILNAAGIHLGLERGMEWTSHTSITVGGFQSVEPLTDVLPYNVASQAPFEKILSSFFLAGGVTMYFRGWVIGCALLLGFYSTA